MGIEGTKTMKPIVSILDRAAHYWLNIRSKPRQRKVFPRRFRWYLWCRDSGQCQYCGKAVDPRQGWHIEHVLPFSLGGPDTEDNLVVACIPCNLKKGTKIVFPEGFYKLPPRYWRNVWRLIFRP